MESKHTQLIKDTYYDPDSGYVGADKLYHRLKSKGVKRSEIKAFLEKQETYQVNKKTVQGSFVPTHQHQEFQIDLVYIENAGLNKFSYALTCVDAFSKIGDAELMKTRTQTAAADAMRAVFERMGIPETVYCDEGSEFDSTKFKELMDKHSIELILTLNHAPMVERFNRTIKEMIEKYLQATQSKAIANILPRVIKNYNSSYHKTIEMAPNEVNDDTADMVYRNILRKAKKKKWKKVRIGDRVRVMEKAKSHRKGYKPKFTKAVHTVLSREGRYYTVDGLHRQYLRSALQLVTGDVEAPTIEPDNKGTLEAHLRELHRLKREAKKERGDDDEDADDMEATKEMVGRVKKRVRKKTAFFKS